jgi:Holliday junction resolvase RusA-like endonuclease
MKTELLLDLFVHGDPTAQPRQRHAIRKGKGGKQFIQNYTPKDAKVQDWKAMVGYAAAPHLPQIPHAEPLRVSITWYFRRPKKHFIANNPDRPLKSLAPRFMVSKPDRDNLDKAVLDTMTDIGFWHDDAQVAGGELLKLYANPGEHLGAQIKVERYLV